MVTGIVVTHGRLGEELLDTARKIIGDFSHCYAVSNDGKSPQALHDEIVSVMEVERDTPVIIFVDFFGGSCSHACLKIESLHEACVICGVNLPMLLAFLNKRDDMPIKELPKEIIERSHNSIMILDPTKL